MKKFLYMLVAGATLLAIPSCSDPDDEITDVEYSSYFRPTSLTAKLATNTDVTLSWHTNCAPEGFKAEFYTNESYSGDPSWAATMKYSGSQIADCTWTFNDLTPETTYYIRLCATGETKQSEWVTTSITTKKANSLVAGASTDHTLQVTWNKELMVTHLTWILASDTLSTPDRVDLTDDDRALGAYTFTDLPEGTSYNIALYNGSYCRGQIKMTTTGGSVTPEPEPQPGEPFLYGTGDLLTFTSGATAAGTYTQPNYIFTVTDEDTKMSIDANSQYFGEDGNYINLTSRLKSGGKSTSKLGFSLQALSDGIIYFYMRSGSSSAERAVTIGDNSYTVGDGNATKGTVTAADGTVTEDKTIFTPYTLEVTAGTTYDFTFDGSINIYGIEYTDGTTSGGGSEPTPEPVAGTDYSLAGITASQISVNSFGEVGSYTLDGEDCPAVNYTGSEKAVMEVTVSTMPSLTMQYSNSSAKSNMMVFGGSFLQTGGKNVILQISGLSAGQEVTVTFAAKGSTAAVLNALSGCTGGDYTNGSKEEYVDAVFTATESTIQIKETSGGMRITKINVN